MANMERAVNNLQAASQGLTYDPPGTHTHTCLHNYDKGFLYKHAGFHPYRDSASMQEAASKGTSRENTNSKHKQAMQDFVSQKHD